MFVPFARGLCPVALKYSAFLSFSLCFFLYRINVFLSITTFVYRSFRSPHSFITDLNLPVNMKFTLAVAAAIASIASASPTATYSETCPKACETYPAVTTPTATSSSSIFTPVKLGDSCISHAQAGVIVSTFQWLLANPKSPAFASTATALFSNSFDDYSDSINSITGQPVSYPSTFVKCNLTPLSLSCTNSVPQLGSATFNSTQAFIAGSGSQPPLYVTTLGYFAGCQEIAWRWQSTSGVGSDEYPVKGIDTFYLNKRGKIDTIYAEFNSAAFLADLGNPQCSSS